MAGEKVFQNVLEYIARSNLNFSIYQTPYSAQLSLKKSFRKNFQKYSEPKVDETFEEIEETFHVKEKTKELEKRLTALNLESLELRKIIETNEGTIFNLESKCKNLEGTLKVEKKKNKKERQKADKAPLDNHEFTVKVENVEMNEKLVENSNIPICNKFETLQMNPCIESEDCKSVEKKDFWSQTHDVKCNICRSGFLSEANLKDHIARNHMQNSNSLTQTSASTFSMISKFQQTVVDKPTFKPYKCFYCEISITSDVFLVNHVKTCPGTRMPTDCEPCVKKPMDKHKMDMHVNTFQMRPMQTAESFGEGFREFCNSELGRSLAKKKMK